MAPKKNAQQTLSLGAFLNDQSLGSWADEMEEVPLPSSESRTGYGGRSTGGQSGGWGGDRGGFGDRGPSNSTPRDALPLPSKPPYTAYVGNLSFEDTLTTDVIGDFFKEEFEKAKSSNELKDKVLTVTNVRIVTDRFEGKSKGFGYVEFGSVDALKFARDQINGASFYGRELRISVADPPKERNDARDIDWVRKGPPADLPNQQRRPSDRGYSRFNDADSEAGGERGSRRGGPAFESDGKERDFDKWERKGPLSPAPGAPGGMREGGRSRGNDSAGRERKQSPAWGEGRSETSRPPRREFQEKPAFEQRPPREPTAPELDNQWRSKMRPDAAARSPAGTPDVSMPSSPTAAPAALSVRPRLNLAKRTVSEAEPSPSSATSDSKASPFGAARPIDTAAREREIEEKRQIAVKEKKEADDKARDEKRAKETAAKTEKKEAASTNTDDKEESKGNGTDSGKNYEILRRMNDENAETDNDAEDANGEIIDDKAVKPKEVVRDPPKKPSGQNWRKPTAKAPTSPSQGTTAENLDSDGWSTVPVPSRGKGRRGGGNQGARAIAS